MNLSELVQKIVFYRLEESAAGQQSQSGSVKLRVITVANNPWAWVIC